MNKSIQDQPEKEYFITDARLFFLCMFSRP